jgi:predicted nucleic acid-binding protein
MVDQFANHESSFVCFLDYTSDPHAGLCSTHAIAECYAVLTTLPLARPVTPGDARTLIRETLLSRLRVVELQTDRYLGALDELAEMGRPGGTIYDALHVQVAQAEGCERIYTYNLRHFRPLCPEGIQVSAP